MDHTVHTVSLTDAHRHRCECLQTVVLQLVEWSVQGWMDIAQQLRPHRCTGHDQLDIRLLALARTIHLKRAVARVLEGMYDMLYVHVEGMYIVINAFALLCLFLFYCKLNPEYVAGFIQIQSSHF